MKQFGLFAKAGIPGQVKTRLAKTIGDNSAAEIYSLFVETILGRFANTGDRQVLAYSPAEELPHFQQLVNNNWHLEPQANGNLGARMQAYFRDAFESGADQVILIGTDSPDLPEKYIEQAFNILNTAEVAIGPCDDGGYYLVGMSTYRPEIFDDIIWSTDSVFQTTLERLDENEIPYRQLPVWYDVDTQPDLIRLCTQLNSMNASDTSWQSKLVSQIELILKSRTTN